MAEFHETPLYRIVEKMKASGNAPGIIELWKNMVAHMVERKQDADAEAIKAWLPLWRPRAIYTPAELVPIFPALALALGLGKMAQMSPALLANKLQMARLPHREIAGVKFFAVERCHFWRAAENDLWIEEFRK